MKSLCLTAALALSVSYCAVAQISPPTPPNSPLTSNDVTIEIVHHQHLEGTIGNTDFTGYEVYRIYADIGTDNFLHSLTSWEESEGVSDALHDIKVTAECGCYEYPNGFFLADLACVLETFFPEVALDSYLTIGKSSSCDPGEVLISTNIPEGLDNASALLCETVISDGSIYAPAGSVNGWADAEGKVLIGQVTTCGAVSFESCFEVWPFGIEDIAIQVCASAAFIPVYGCMDPAAFNYNPEANIADGSCIGAVSGCTDETACNFEPEANVDNGTCELPGCNDLNACNYSPDAACFDEMLCVFIGVVSITGENYPDLYSEEVYQVVNPTPGSTYTWEITNGEILQGQGSESILVYWSSHEYNYINVYETNEIDCTGPLTGYIITIPPPADPVGLWEESADAITLFPNPTTDVVNLKGIRSEEIRSMYAIHSDGKRSILPIGTQVDMRVFPKGLYFLEIQTDRKIIKKRLIVS